MTALTSSFLRAHRLDGRPAARLERVLAVGRAFLTVTALTAIYLDPTEPARLAAITYAVLLAYAFYSVAVLVVVHSAPRLGARHAYGLHGLDILWTAALTFVSQGPVSPFFLFFLFVVLAAAYRWGFLETFGTAVITVAVFLLETGVAATGPWNHTWFASIDVQLNRTILRVTYLLLTGFLLGYLAEQEKRSRAELAAIAETMRQPRVDLGIGGSVTEVARGLLKTFGASAVDFVLQDDEGERTTLWRIDRGSDMTASPRGAPVELDARQRAAWLFAAEGPAWLASRPPHGGDASMRIIEPGAWPLGRGRVRLPAALLEARAFDAVMVATMGLPDGWRGRVYVYDPPLDGGAEQSLHFLHALLEHVTPALTNVLLLGRLRARASAAERARVARELHDGAIQALFGIEMKIEALRRGPAGLAASVEQELEEIQDLLQREVLALRELMQALRPIELDASEQLPDVLAAVIERFRRDTGLPARFVSTGSPVALHPAIALELVRIVQEALVNVRKHSRARNVLIRLTGAGNRGTLAIEDDGQGFDFDGHMTGEELDRRRLGPAIIKERARIAGAQLAIESTPGVGARIEVSFEAGRG